MNNTVLELILIELIKNNLITDFTYRIKRLNGMLSHSILLTHNNIMYEIEVNYTLNTLIDNFIRLIAGYQSEPYEVTIIVYKIDKTERDANVKLFKEFQINDIIQYIFDI